MIDVDAVAEAMADADDGIIFGLLTPDEAEFYRRMARAALGSLTPFWAVAYGDGGQSEECYEDRDRAEETLAEYADATGLSDGYLVTASFTGWERVE